MILYKRQEIVGCIVEEFRAVQPNGDPQVVIDTFGDGIVRSVAVTDNGNALLVTDQRGDTHHVGQGEFVFEHPAGSSHLVVLSEENFLDTYEVSA